MHLGGINAHSYLPEKPLGVPISKGSCAVCVGDIGDMAVFTGVTTVIGQTLGPLLANIGPVQFGVDQSQWLRRKLKYKKPHTEAIKVSING